MKTWPNGIDWDVVKDYENIFAPSNSYSASPFSQIKKNNIAEAINKHVFFVHDNNDASVKPKRVAYIKTVCKKKTDICMYPGVVIGTKLPGDVVYTGLASDGDLNYTGLFKTIFDRDKNNWVTSWASDISMTRYLQIREFRCVGSKITTFGEIQLVWFRDADNTMIERAFPVIPKYEYVTVKKIGAFTIISNHMVRKIADKIADYKDLFQNHYSNYNKGKSWSAFSLRGYTSDPTFMTKPIEMNAKWQEENEGREWVMQDTSLMEKFPEVYELLEHMFGKGINYHRIRLMNLKSGDGELTRHTDQVDPDQGLAPGKLARFHFPIITNPDVKFTVWDVTDCPNTVNMKVGECWVLDVRKPHAAINGGTEDRVHLVVDLEVTPHITTLLEGVIE